MTKVESKVWVAAEDHIALVIEEIAIARLPLAHLPLQVLQRFEALIEAIGQNGETRVAGSLRRAPISATRMATPSTAAGAQALWRRREPPMRRG